MVSFILPAHNEEHYLTATLRAVQASAEALQLDYEIVVVDDASTDATAARAQTLGCRVVAANLRKISAVRNAGARAAGGEWLVFVDADTTVHSALIGQALTALRAGAVGGGASAKFAGRIPVYARLLTAALNRFSRIFHLAYGCFLFCRRDAFEAAGGFDESLYGGEEWALSRALRKQGRFVILPATVVTSGRRLRAYSAFEILRIFGGLVLGGTRAVRRRDKTAMWYEPRRTDPDRTG